VATGSVVIPTHAGGRLRPAGTEARDGVRDWGAGKELVTRGEVTGE